MMSIRNLFAVTKHSGAVSLALLLLRVVVGLAFVFHGWGKIQHPFDWMGEDSWAPPFLQALAALAEFGGGLAWIAGLLTPLASLGIACTMAVATGTMVLAMHAPFVSAKGGPSFELALVYFCVSAALLATGPGLVSLDRLIFGWRRAPWQNGSSAAAAVTERAAVAP